MDDSGIVISSRGGGRGLLRHRTQENSVSSQICQRLALSPWKSLSASVPTCKMGMMIMHCFLPPFVCIIYLGKLLAWSESAPHNRTWICLVRMVTWDKSCNYKRGFRTGCVQTLTIAFSPSLS